MTWCPGSEFRSHPFVNCLGRSDPTEAKRQSRAGVSPDPQGQPGSRWDLETLYYSFAVAGAAQRRTRLGRLNCAEAPGGGGGGCPERLRLWKWGAVYVFTGTSISPAHCPAACCLGTDPGRKLGDLGVHVCVLLPAAKSQHRDAGPGGRPRLLCWWRRVQLVASFWILSWLLCKCFWDVDMAGGAVSGSV